MVKRRSTPGGRLARRNTGPRKEAFVFEPGEKALSLPVKTVAAEVLEKGELYQYSPTPDKSSIPDHLRCLGVRFNLKLVGEGAFFLEGPRTLNALTKDVKLPFPDKKELPTFKVVAPAGTKVMVVVSFTLKYKDV